MGNGLYIKKGGHICEVETDGKRLLLEPVGVSVKLHSKLGDGLYLKTVKRKMVVVCYCGQTAHLKIFQY